MPLTNSGSTKLWNSTKALPNRTVFIQKRIKFQMNASEFRCVCAGDCSVCAVSTSQKSDSVAVLKLLRCMPNEHPRLADVAVLGGLCLSSAAPGGQASALGLLKCICEEPN